MDKLEKYIEKLEKLVELEEDALKMMISIREEMEMFNNEEYEDLKDCE